MDIESIVDRYISSEKQIRQQITDTVRQEELSGLYHSFMREMAKESVRQKSKKLLTKGIYANVIENCSWDLRDNLRCLTLLYYSAGLLGLDPNEEFKKVANDTEGEGRGLLLSFIRRPKNLKTLECMGYQVIQEPNFDYIDKPFEN